MTSCLTKLAACLLIAFSILLSGCERAESASSTEPAKESAVAAKPAGPAGRATLAPNAYPQSPHFNRVMSHLDIGGKTLRYQDHEGRREMIIGLLDAALGLIPAEDAKQFPADTGELVDALGIAQSAAAGRSLRQDGDAYLLRSYTHVPQGHSPLARLLGDQAVAFRSPDLLPAATDLAIETRLDTSALPALILRIAKAGGKEEEVRKGLAEQLPSGQSAQELLSKTNLHIVLGLDVSHWSDESASSKPVDFFIQIDGAKPLLDPLLPGLRESFGEPAVFGNRSGWEIPLPPLFGQANGKAVALYDENGRITFASRNSYLTFVEGETLKLSNEKDFHTATRHFPKSGNLLFYASRQLPPAIAMLVTQNAGALGESPGAFLDILGENLGPQTWSFCVAYEPDGVLATGRLPIATEISPGTATAWLAATSTMFVGARAWKRGSDRAGCIMNIRNVQQAVRSYQNMNDHKIGDPLPLAEVVGRNKYVETMPVCPGGGSYTFSKTIPKVGDLACQCSHAEKDQHVPAAHQDW